MYRVSVFLLSMVVPVMAQTGSISGKVTDSATGQGIRKADVTVQMPGGAGGRGYRAVTDASGAFRIADLEPGAYQVLVLHQGYSIGGRTLLRPRTVNVGAGEAVTGVDFKLIPPGVIAGRVVDEDGDAVVQAQVTMLHYRYINGRRQMVNANRAGATDDQGNFRLFGIDPGKYYLAVSVGALRMPATAGGAPTDDYVQTFYPGTADPAAATQIEIAAGAEMQGTQIMLRRVRVAAVRGRVINESGAKPERYQVTLLPSLRIGGMRSHTALVAEDGAFEIAGVPPGTYFATSAIPSENGTAVGQAEVEVAGNDVEDVMIRITRGFEVAGRVRFEGEAKSGEAAAVLLQPADNFSVGGSNGHVAEDGSFRLERVYPGRYTVLVSAPASHYLKTVRLAGQDVTDDPVDLVKGGGPIEIAMGSNPAAMQGFVRRDGAAVSGARVVLAPVSEKRRRNQVEYRVLRTDERGMFRWSGLRPGEYRLYAWMDIEEGSWLDPDFMRRFENKAVKVTLAEGSQELVEVEIIPPEE